MLGAAVEVHRQLGEGFLERVYQRALSLELRERGIPHKCEVSVPILYKGHELDCNYRADMICFDGLLVELKSQSDLTEVDEAQVINYLRATQFERALLLNFGKARLQVKRPILTEDRKHPPSPKKTL